MSPTSIRTYTIYFYTNTHTRTHTHTHTHTHTQCKTLYPYLVVDLGEEEGEFEAIEEELPLVGDDVNILSEISAADSGQRVGRRLHLERQRSTQYEPELLSPQQSQPTTPMDERGIRRQLSKQKSVNEPIKRQLSKQMSITDPLKRQLSKQKSLNMPPEKMDKGATKDEQSRLIQEESAETGNVS